MIFFTEVIFSTEDITMMQTLAADRIANQGGEIMLCQIFDSKDFLNRSYNFQSFLFL